MHGVISPFHPPYAFVAHIETTLQQLTNRIILKNIYVPGFTTVGMLLDVVVWWLGRGLDLYEETNTKRVSVRQLKR